MTILTPEELKKIPKDTLIPVKYWFDKYQVFIDTGYIEREGVDVFLKHNVSYFNGYGRINVRGCKFSCALYSDDSPSHNLNLFKVLRPFYTRTIGEL